MSLAAAYMFGVKQGVDALFLDEFTGSSGAWSLRKLKSTSDKVIRVRRTSDNLENDFAESEINDGTLTTFCASTNGRVKVIYDQIGSNNFTMTSFSNQGEIVTNGSLNLLNGKPIILRKNDACGYLSTYAPNSGSTVKNILFVGNLTNFNNAVLLGSANGDDDVFLARALDTRFGVHSQLTFTDQKKNGLAFNPTTRTEVRNQTENQFLYSNNVNFNFAVNNIGLGYRSGSQSYGYGMFSFQELIIFENTTDISDKQIAINNEYSIY
jgi:hypothetical protein